MSTQFKHRLIGTIVLVALLVIILPDVFDGQKTAKKEQISTIPFAPKPAGEKPLMFDLNQPKGVVADGGNNGVDNLGATAKTEVSSVFSKSQKKNQLIQPDNSSASNGFKKSGWIIQLATLKSADGTRRLIELLQKAGYQAHSYPRIPVDGQLNRIFVGPELSKVAMDNKLQKLKQLTGLKGLVKKFDPTDH
ncbi:MAG: Cell division protein DedD [Candidatus Celerinatantimonas neptuna]|nr:MAG: Cell division protein DedD [Candidatus Celerinatantimonas neptuna]